MVTTSETRSEADVNRYLAPLPERLRPGYVPPALNVPLAVFEAAQAIARDAWRARMAEQLVILESSRHAPVGEPPDETLVTRARRVLDALHIRGLHLDELTGTYVMWASQRRLGLEVAQVEDAIVSADRLVRQHDNEKDAARRQEAQGIPVRGLARRPGVIPPHFAPRDGETLRLTRDQVGELEHWWEKFQNATRGKLPPCPFTVLD